MSYRVLTIGNLDEGAVTFGEYRARVQAVGVAMLFAYLVFKIIDAGQLLYANVCNLRESRLR